MNIRKYNKIIFILLAFLLVSSPVVSAVSLGQGLIGSEKEVLSKVDTFAGNGSFALEDGSALSASFGLPYSMATLPDGSIVVSDSRNQRIRKITDGQVQTYAGITFENDIYGNPLGGWSDGNNNLAVFSNPSGITADTQGNVYIADAGNNSIRVISLNGQVTTLAGDGLIGYQDGVGENAKFNHPLDVVVAKDGTLYVADTLNHLIRKITTDGEVSTLNSLSERTVEIIDGMVEFAGDYLDGNLKEAKFNEPSGLALDSKGNLYVSDSGNQLLRYIDFETNTVTTVAGNLQQSIYNSQTNAMYAEGGFADGSALESSFNFPKGLAVTDEGGVLIADSLNHRIRYLFNGTVTTLVGDYNGRHGNADGINGHNQLHNPTDVVVMEDGSILIADNYNNLIRKFTLYQLPENLAKDKQKKIVMDSVEVILDTLPKVVNGRIMVPISSYAKEMGYLLEVSDDEKTVLVMNGDVSIEFTIDEAKIIIQKGTEKIEKAIEIAPFADETTIYLPLRVLSEEFNLDVQWNHENQTVILREINSKINSLGNKHIESFRETQIEDVVGIVQIRRAGGSKVFRAFEGMTLYHGDHIMTEANSSLVFRIPDSGDEVTIGEKAQLYISDLCNTSEGNKTRVFIWSGSVWIYASSLLSSEDEFEIETPEGTMDIQGTTLLVGVDPQTGESKFFIASGVGRVSNNTRDNLGTATLYPSHQLNITLDTDENLNDYTNIIDFDNLSNEMTAKIIEAIIKNKQAIDEENEKYMQNLKEQQQLGQQSNQAEFDRINSNLDNLVGNIIRKAIEQNKVDESVIKSLIDQVNQQIDKKIDLSEVKTLQLSEAERRKQEQLKKLEEQRKQQLEQQKQRQEELKKQNEELLRKLKEQKEKQEAAKAKAQEEAKKKAEEEFLKKLENDAARAAFEAKKKALEEAKKRQNDAVTQPISNPSPDTTQGGNTSRPDDSDEPVQQNWSRESLVSAIEQAYVNLESVFISVDGSGIETTFNWVTIEDMDAYHDVVSSAREVAENNEASQAEINQAVEKLKDAKTVFDAAKKAGTGPTLILVSPLEEIYINNSSVEIVIQTEINNTVTLSVSNSDISTTITGSGIGTNVTIKVDGLEDGEYVFTLQAMDQNGNVTTLVVPKIIIEIVYLDSHLRRNITLG